MPRDFESKLEGQIALLKRDLDQINEMKLKILEISKRQATAAEASLTFVMKQFEGSKSPRESNAWLLPLSTSIFLYEFASTQYSSALALTDLARQIGLKNTAHKLYEFEIMLSKTYRTKITEIAQSFDIDFDEQKINSIRKTVGPALKAIRKLEHARNVAGAHFDNNTAEYLAAVKSIEFNEIHAAGLAMFKFCSEVQKEVLEILLKAKNQGAFEFNTKTVND